MQIALKKPSPLIYLHQVSRNFSTLAWVILEENKFHRLINYDYKECAVLSKPSYVLTSFFAFCEFYFRTRLLIMDGLPTFCEFSNVLGKVSDTVGKIPRILLNVKS